MSIERNLDKNVLKSKTRVYMRIHNEGRVTSLILDDAQGEIALKKRPAGDKVFCNFSGKAGVIFKPISIVDLKKRVFEIEKVYFNPPYTVVIWVDGTKTKIKCQDGDIYDPEKGLALAISKKALGNKGSWYEVFKKFISPADLEREPAPASQPNPEPQEEEMTSGAKYKVGDKVLIKKEISNSEEYHWFDDLKGRVVTITEYDEHETGELKFQFDGYWSPEDWIEKKVEE